MSQQQSIIKPSQSLKYTKIQPKTQCISFLQSSYTKIHRIQLPILSGIQKVVLNHYQSISLNEMSKSQKVTSMGKIKYILCTFIFYSQYVKLKQKKTQQFRDDIRGQAPERKKRSRRTADQIQRQYQCSNQKCNKSYGTEGSLHQHIKLKHPDLYQFMKKNLKITTLQSIPYDSQQGSFLRSVDSNQQKKQRNLVLDGNDEFYEEQKYNNSLSSRKKLNQQKQDLQSC